MKLLLTMILLMFAAGCSTEPCETAESEASTIMEVGDVTVEDDDVTSDDLVLDSAEDDPTLEVESDDAVTEVETEVDEEEPESLDEDPTGFEEASFSGSDFFHPEVP